MKRSFALRVRWAVFRSIPLRSGTVRVSMVRVYRMIRTSLPATISTPEAGAWLTTMPSFLGSVVSSPSSNTGLKPAALTASAALVISMPIILGTLPLSTASSNTLTTIWSPTCTSPSFSGNATSTLPTSSGVRAFLPTSGTACKPTDLRASTASIRLMPTTSGRITT